MTSQSSWSNSKKSNPDLVSEAAEALVGVMALSRRGCCLPGSSAAASSSSSAASAKCQQLWRSASL